MTRPVGFYTDKKKRVRPITRRKRRLVVPNVKYTLQREREIEAKRSKRARAVDEALEAEEVSPGPLWEAHPNKYDIRGVDYFPVPLSHRLKDNFDLNNQIIRKEYEDFLNVDLSNGRRKVGWKKNAELPPGAYAVYNPTFRTIYYSKDATKVLESGKIKDVADAYAIKTIAHEMGHAVRHIETGVDPYSLTSPMIEEGSNEILANRFTLNNIQLPKHVREHILRDPALFVAYQDYMSKVADLALLANNGDEHKAIEWIKKLRTTQDQLRFIWRSLRKRGVDPSSVMTGDGTVKREVIEILDNKGITPTEYRTYYADKGERSMFWYLYV